MRQLRSDLWVLPLGWISPFDSNAYLIDDAIDPETGERGSGAVTLIDTGPIGGSLQDILEETEYEPADIDRILLTHFDLDHTGGLDRDYDCPVYLGAQDIDMATGRWSPPLAHHKGLFHRITRRIFPLPDGIDLKSVGEGERIGKFTAYHTPGHNPGHMVYVHDSGVAFLGDLIWETDGELTTPFWGDSYDMRRLRESIKKLARRVDPFEIACMGHGEPILAGGNDRLQTLAAQL